MANIEEFMEYIFRCYDYWKGEGEEVEKEEQKFHEMMKWYS